MRGFIFASNFYHISRGFNFANWLPVDFSRGFIFEYLSFINVLYILIFSYWHIIVVCSSASSMWVTELIPSFSIFQIALFGCKRLNSRLSASEEIKKSRQIKKKKIKFFLLFCLFIYCLISCKIFLTWPSLIGKEPNVKI